MSRFLHTCLLALFVLLLAGQGAYASHMPPDSAILSYSDSFDPFSLSLPIVQSGDQTILHAASQGHHKHADHHEPTIVEKEEEEDKTSAHMKTSASNYFTILCIVLICGHVFNDDIISASKERVHSLTPGKRYILIQVFRI